MGAALVVNTRLEDRRGVHYPHRSTGWARFTRRREVVCGVNKVRRADTVQLFSAFGLEMVEFPLTASALARTEEKKKHEARRAYAKRNALREKVRGVEHGRRYQ